MPRLNRYSRAVKRADLIEAAMRRFALRGPVATSIGDIAAASQTSAGSIYSHFRDKADLFETVARAALDDGLAVLGRHRMSPVVAGPDGILADLVASIHPDTARVSVQAWAGAATDPVLRDIVTSALDEMQGLLRLCIGVWLVDTGHCTPEEATARATDPASEVAARYQDRLLRAALAPLPEEPAPGKPDPWKPALNRFLDAIMAEARGERPPRPKIDLPDW